MSVYMLQYYTLPYVQAAFLGEFHLSHTARRMRTTNCWKGHQEIQTSQMAKVKALQKSRAQKECVGGSSLNWQDWASKCIVHCCINIEMVIAWEPWHVLAMVLFLEETASVAGIPCSVEPFQQGLRKTEWQSHGRGAPRCPAEELSSEVCLRIQGFTVPVPSRNKHISCLAVSRDLHCLKETHGQHQELQQISQRPLGPGDFSYTMQAHGITFHHSQKARGGEEKFMCHD